MTLGDFLRLWPYLPSREGKQMLASGSERRRWFERGSVEVNGAKAKPDDPYDAEASIVLHPNGRHRTTLQ